LGYKIIQHRLSHRDQITPTLKQLRWLSIRVRIAFKKTRIFSSIQLLVNKKFLHKSSFKLIKKLFSIYATLFIKVGENIRGKSPGEEVLDFDSIYQSGNKVPIVLYREGKVVCSHYRTEAMMPQCSWSEQRWRTWWNSSVSVVGHG